jgi:pantoate--beta-alanine ligase
VAMSSRNSYLSPAERSAATVLSRGLHAAADAAMAGERDPRALARTIEATVAAEPLVALEYAEVRRATDLEPVDRLDGELLIAVAAQVGSARLLDNVTITIAGDEVTTDLGVTTQESGTS